MVGYLRQEQDERKNGRKDGNLLHDRQASLEGTVRALVRQTGAPSSAALASGDKPSDNSIAQHESAQAQNCLRPRCGNGGSLSGSVCEDPSSGPRADRKSTRLNSS